MKTKLCGRLLALLLCLCMLLNGGVLAEETIEVIAESMIPAEEIAAEETAEVCIEEETPVLIEVTPLSAPEVTVGENWALGENDGLVIPCDIGTDEIIFRWTAVEGAVSYRIETVHISESGSAEDIREIGTTAETSIALPVSEYGDGWYALGVIAEAEDGRTSACKQVFCLEVEAEEEAAEEMDVSAAATTLAITAQPTSVTVAEGQKATVTVKAVGDGLTYAWYMKDEGDTDYTKSSITTNSYSVVMNSTRNGRRLICYVYDKYGNKVKSNTAVIRMGTKLQITQQPTSVTVAEGQKATVTVKAAGDGLTYEWYTREANDTKYYKSSITGNSYSVVMNAARNGRRLICYVKDKYGIKLQCNTVMIKMGTKLEITQQPASVTVAEGQKATVTVKAVGDGLTYEWYTREASSDTYYKSSITGNTYSVVMNAARNGRRLICYVKDKYGIKLQCNTVMIKMGTKLEITQQPTSVTVANGENASVRVVAQGDGLTYTWFASDVGDNGVYYQSGSITGDTYTVVMNDTRAGRKVYCVVGDKYGNTVQSNTATLNRSSSLAIVTQPKNVTVNEGEMATVTVEATGEGLKYEWYTREADSDTYYKSSITGNTYSVMMNAARNGRQLYCIVSDKYGNTVQSNTVIIRMRTELVITQHPDHLNGLTGQTASFTVVAQGDGLTYEWFIRKSTSDLFESTGCTQNTYSFTLTAEHHNATLYCIVKDAYGRQMNSAYVLIHALGGNRPRLTAEYFNSTYIELNWDQVANATGYRVYASEDGGTTYTQVHDTYNGSQTLCYIRDLKPNYVYHMKVQAYYNNGGIMGIESAAATVFNGESKVKITSVEFMNNSAAKVKWEPLSYATGYYLYRTSATGTVNVNYPSANLGSGITEYVIYSLSAGSYKFAMAAAIKGVNNVVCYPTSVGPYYEYDHKPGDGTVTYRALLIGNDYADLGTAWDLPGKVENMDVYSAFLSRYPGTDYEITKRSNQTAAQIISSIDDVLSDADHDDVSLFHYGGHGGESGTLIGYDKKHVSIDELRTALDQIPGKKIVILECCHSGRFINKSASEEASAYESFNNKVVNAFAAKQRGTLTTNDYVVITSCAGDELGYAFPYVDPRSGKDSYYCTLSYAIAKGSGFDLLKWQNCSASADDDANGKITLGECYDEACVFMDEIFEKHPDLSMNAQYYGDRSFVLWKK